MKKLSIFALSIAILALPAELAAAEGNSFVAYETKTQQYQVGIVLENLSRNTFAIDTTSKQERPIFYPGDSVRFEVELTRYTVPVEEIRNWLLAKYGEHSIVEIRSRFQASFKVSGEKIYAPTYTYNFIGQSVDVSEDLNGEFEMGRSAEILFESLSTDYEVELYDYSSRSTEYEYFAENSLINFNHDSKMTYLFNPLSKLGQEVIAPSISAISVNHKTIPFVLSSTSNITPESTDMSPTICKVTKGTLVLKSPGNCSILVSLPGDEIFSQSKNKVIAFKVTKANKNSIVCSSAKKIIQLPSKSKKCEAGAVTVL